MHADRDEQLTGGPGERLSLGFLPTPVQALPRFSRLFSGPEILVKRDDLTGLAFGGNKTRKLEYLVQDALRSGCDVLVTAGAAQSNHCRQTAAAAAACGLACHLALGGGEPEERNGNLLISTLCGAEVHWCGDDRKGEGAGRVMETLQAAGHRPYFIPYGGSNAIGALGFVAAAHELHAQLREADEHCTHIVIASSSGGTHAGLLVGMRELGAPMQIVGIGIDKDNTVSSGFPGRIAALACETSAQRGAEITFSVDEVLMDDRFLGQGYGIMGEPERKAIRTLAETEGILLDPVYTARAMAGLVAMLEEGVFSAEDRILFWHTGGTPALFPYAGDLLH